MSYMDRTFCSPDFADKPECAECRRKFDEYKYRMHCDRTGFDEDVSFSAVRLCESNTSQKPVATKPKYHSNTKFSKMVFGADDTNNDITCGKIDRANTTKRKAQNER